MNTPNMSLMNTESVTGKVGNASQRTGVWPHRLIFNFLLMCVVAASTLTISSVAAAAQTIVSLTFDDGLTQSPVRNMLLSHGMKGTFYVNSNMIGAGGDYLTKAELDALYADGNEIAGHTINHVDLATLSDAAQRAAICNDLQTLNTWYPGQIHSFAYPYASTGPTTQSIVAAGCPGVGQYSSARTVGGLVSGSQCTGCATAESIPPGNPYYIQTPESIMSTTTLDQLKTLVTQAETNGGWVPLVFHNVCNGCSAYAVSPATLDAFLTWLQARAVNNTVVKTVNQVMTGDLPAPPPSPLLGPNQLINPSLELDQDANNQADCWQRDGYGTNTSIWTRTADAHAQAFGEKVQITSYSSGDRKLLPALDAGQASGGCAPMLEAGASYQLGAWYKATTSVTPVLFYRNASGAWLYWRDGPLLPASTSWAEVNFNPGAIPAGALALSFGIALDAVGTLTTDDYSMRKVLAGTADTAAPTVTLTAPAAGTVSGAVTVTANATDNVGVVGVQFRLDGVNLGAEVTTSPYAVTWNTATVTNGTHSLTAVARDAAGNSATAATVTVTVNNAVADTTAPTVSLTAPAAGTVTGTVNVSANAADNVGVVGVQFRIDGANLATEDTTSPYAVAWNSAGATNGTHSLTAVARDAAGNTATSSAVTVTVSNAAADTVAPTVSLTAPAAGTVTGAVSVTANAADNVGVVGVQFRLDGVNLGSEDTTSPYSISWDSTTATNGAHNLTAVARDAAGNIATSTAVAVTVSNLSQNLVLNPSLETDANSNGVPDCWQLGGFGTNTFIWTRVASAHSGSFAESLQITSRSSGDRKLVQTQDSGACAPAITPGARYTLSAWYTSTVPSAFVVFYRTSAGAWRYWTTGPTVAAAGNWTQAVYTTPAIPAGATHLSFGLYLSTVGTLVTDDYAMVLAP